MSKRAKLQSLFAQLDKLYAELPAIVCKGLCSVACSSIPLTLIEAKRLQTTQHLKPRTTPDYVCIYLQNNRCTAYAARPLICRAWGVLPNLSCMHGCVPERWLKATEFVALAQQVEQLQQDCSVLVTMPDGLVVTSQSFSRFGPTIYSEIEQARNEDRVRSLRALHGGRILVAVEKQDT